MELKNLVVQALQALIGTCWIFQQDSRLATIQNPDLNVINHVRETLQRTNSKHYIAGAQAIKIHTPSGMITDNCYGIGKIFVVDQAITGYYRCIWWTN